MTCSNHVFEEMITASQVIVLIDICAVYINGISNSPFNRMLGF